MSFEYNNNIEKRDRIIFGTNINQMNIVVVLVILKDWTLVS